jgi:acyl carrier protein
MTDVAFRVASILSRVLAIDLAEVSPTLTRDTCKTWDSLRHMELIVTIEDEFKLVLEYDEIVRMESLDSIVQTLEARR